MKAAGQRGPGVFALSVDFPLGRTPESQREAEEVWWPQGFSWKLKSIICRLLKPHSGKTCGKSPCLGVILPSWGRAQAQAAWDRNWEPQQSL